MLQRVVLAAVVLMGWQMPGVAQEGGLAPGVKAIFRSGEAIDAVVLPNYWFYQPEGEPATPFLTNTTYEVEFAGLVSVDLRGQFTFQAELNGELVVEVNGKEVLRESGKGGLGEVSRPFRLNKGTNSVVAKFTPPKEGAGQLRLYWIPRKGVRAPIPQEAISHEVDGVTRKWGAMRAGRELFAELRCVKCHEGGMSGMPELVMDAPSFAGIGERLRSSWMAEWIENPRGQRASAKMPKLLQGEAPAEEARAIAAFLGSLRSAERVVGNGGSKEQGKKLFTELRCEACHSVGESERASDIVDLRHLARKFLAGSLEEFLLDPQAHYKWIAMPNFELSGEEAASLGSYLRGDAGEAGELGRSAELIEEGRRLVQTRGCLNCHELELENRFEAPSLVEVTGSAGEGCLAEAPSGRAADYGLNAEAREQLRELLTDGLHSLRADTLREFTKRQAAALNCAACHGKAEGFTRFDLLGEKLDPHWSADFIAGKVPEKPRPWLAARMPAFPHRAEPLARGLAVLHGHSPVPLPPEPVDKELAEIGRKLVSADGGFSCTACHAVGASPPAQVFEAPGVNLAQSGERLRETFFHRWMLNPLAVDPATKMPVYFDEEGRSPLTDVFEGNGSKQIEAIWEYLQLEARKRRQEGE